MTIRAVLLDLGNVLISIDVRRCHSYLKKIGAPPLEELSSRIEGSEVVEHFERGAISPAEFYKKVAGAFKLDISDETFWEIWNAMYAPEPTIPEGVLAGLRRNGRLILLSNTNPVHFAMVKQRYSVLKHFDECIVSFEIGATKPDDRMYKAALATSACPPDECFFADDLLPHVDGARSHGIDAVQFQSLEQLQDEFRSRGVSW
jgi:HAD superfamily hydrolase (TIGR01509 family)